MQERISLLKELGRMAGHILNSYYGKLTGYDMKGGVDLVTEADNAVEEAVISKILDVFPNDCILAEESGTHDGTNEFTWIIDPLDGTTNFAHSFPFFGFSCAIQRGNTTVAGLVEVPFLKETYFAEMNKGAYLNGNKIMPSKEDKLNRSLLVTGFPYFREKVVEELLAPIRKVILNAQGLRRGGSAAVDLCFIAAGRLDGFFEIGLKPWDVAAGELIVREAGGKMSDYKGNQFNINSESLVATNGLIHNELIEKVLT